ncbi:MAG: hypothetical protein HS111_03075 [Kofleriaceae bacterium]|nr:hypothetical protein [Kofleriaceae bacterium]
MRGQARPDPDVPADTVTVRLSYDDFADPSPPRDHPVVIVGYRFDLVVGGKVVKSDAQARATIDRLDRRGATSYFAMTLLPRGDDHDRLISALVLGSGAGLRLVLSGARRDEPTVADDLGALDPQPSAGVPAGEVHVDAGRPGRGRRAGGAPRRAHRAGGGHHPRRPATPISTRSRRPGTAPTTPPSPAAPSCCRSTPTPRAPPAPGSRSVPDRRPSSPAGAPPPPSWTAVTDGNARGSADRAAHRRHPRRWRWSSTRLAVPVRTLSLPAAGGRRELARVTWRPRGQGAAPSKRRRRARATLRRPLAPARASPVCRRRSSSPRAAATRRRCWSSPRPVLVQPAGLGPRRLPGRARHLHRAQQLARPYLPGTIRQARGAGGAAAARLRRRHRRRSLQRGGRRRPHRGFVVRDPVPPGGFAFVGHFSLKTDGGAVRWDMDLPYGTLESVMELKRTPAMELELPPRVPAREAVDERGTWYVLSPISIQPKQRLVFTVTGLPARPTWVRWSKPVVGALVVLLLLGAAVLALVPTAADGGGRGRELALRPARRRAAALTGSADPDDVARRERLMGELAALVRARDGGVEAR